MQAQQLIDQLNWEIYSRGECVDDLQALKEKISCGIKNGIVELSDIDRAMLLVCVKRGIQKIRSYKYGIPDEDEVRKESLQPLLKLHNDLRNALEVDVYSKKKNQKEA